MKGTAKHFRKRDAILSCLCRTATHPSADWVYAQLKPDFPDLALGTVYRNLTLFKQQGLIASVGTVDGVERFDGNTQPHAHFICSCCGSVTDMEGVEIPPALYGAAGPYGQALAYQLNFTGVCRNCIMNDQEESA